MLAGELSLPPILHHSIISAATQVKFSLHVNVEALTGADFDGVKAMHQLFQIFRQYSGELVEYKDKEGNEQVAVSFGSLMLMRSWFERYEEYQKEVKECRHSKSPVYYSALQKCTQIVPRAKIKIPASLEFT